MYFETTTHSVPVDIFFFSGFAQMLIYSHNHNTTLAIKTSRVYPQVFSDKLAVESKYY